MSLAVRTILLAGLLAAAPAHGQAMGCDANTGVTSAQERVAAAERVLGLRRQWLDRAMQMDLTKLKGEFVYARGEYDRITKLRAQEYNEGRQDRDRDAQYEAQLRDMNRRMAFINEMLIKQVIGEQVNPTRNAYAAEIKDATAAVDNAKERQRKAADERCAMSKPPKKDLQPKGFVELPPLIMPGTYDSDFGVMELNAGGGKYDYQGGQVSFTKVEGAHVEGKWTQTRSAKDCSNGGGDFHGKFVWDFNSSGFSGKWGYCESDSDGGGWSGRRKG